MGFGVLVIKTTAITVVPIFMIVGMHTRHGNERN